MGLIDNIKPLFTVLSSAVKKSQQREEKNSRELPESNPGLLGEKQVSYYLCAMQPALLVDLYFRYTTVINQHDCSCSYVSQLRLLL